MYGVGKGKAFTPKRAAKEVLCQSVSGEKGINGSARVTSRKLIRFN